MKRYLGIGLTLALVAGMLGAVACGDDDDDAGGATATVPAVAATPTPGAGTESLITVEGAWARNSPGMAGGMMTPGAGMTPGGMMTPGAGMTPGGMTSGDRGAAYMVIKNSGDADDALIAATSTLADATEVHESRMEGDVATMVEVERVPVPAGGQAELKPGSFHIMFIGLKQPLEAGTTVTFELEFEKAGKIAVTAEVRSS